MKRIPPAVLAPTIQVHKTIYPADNRELVLKKIEKIGVEPQQDWITYGKSRKQDSSACLRRGGNEDPPDKVRR